MVGAWLDTNEAVKCFPHLFREVVWPWGPTRACFEMFLEEEPPEELIANVNLVPGCVDGWLILQLDDGSWEVPGGTLEPGETYTHALARELREEAGAEIKSFRLFGAWHCFSMAETPYRSHLPFPEFYRAVAVGEAKLVSAPGNPPTGEKVREAICVSLQEAMMQFEDQGRQDLAELYALASIVHTKANHPG